MPEQMNHPHTHTHDVTCEAPECGHERHEKYTHAHDGGHEFHQHRSNGAQLIKLDDDVIEPTFTDDSGIWNG